MTERTSRYLGTTLETEQADVYTKEDAIKYVKEKCAKQGCTCNPEIEIIDFEVDGNTTKAEIIIDHEAHCIIGAAASA